MTGVKSIADRIDALLPQTQCRRCGFAGCRPYAEAVAARTVAINRCPPGGETTISALARLLDVPPLPLDPAVGRAQPFAIACIDEVVCIGCTLCIQACPVDAIVGAPKLMHTVIADHCTGCELCLPPCPVDCIAMLPPGRPWTSEDAKLARERVAAHNARVVRRAPQRDSRTPEAAPVAAAAAARERRQAAVGAALARARARRAAPRSSS